MSSGVAPTPSVAAEASVGIAVEIDVDGRWDALALSKRLIPFHSFLDQHPAERWVVHARAPGYHGEPLASALSAIADRQAQWRLRSSVRVAGRPIGSRR